jgi:DNA-binding FadR family transcriptional regulator
MVGAMDISGAAQGIEYPVRRNAVLAAHRRIYETLCGGDSELAGEAMRARSPST